LILEVSSFVRFRESVLNRDLMKQNCVSNFYKQTQITFANKSGTQTAQVSQRATKKEKAISKRA
jgi:hypothetical protein